MIPTIETLMSKNLDAIEAERSVQAAAEQMARVEAGSLLVTREGDFVGLITEVDIVRKGVAKQLSLKDLKVGDVMSAPLITVRTDQSIIEANGLMETNKVRHLAVTQFGRVVGMVSVRDFLHPLFIEESAESLKRFASLF